MPEVTVKGPDGNFYQFPDGTTHETAVAFFKKKMASTQEHKSTGATGSWSPDYSNVPVLGPLARFGRSAVETAKSAITAPIHAITDEPQTPEEQAAYAAASTMGVGRAGLAAARLTYLPQLTEARKAVDKSLSTSERFGHGLAAATPIVGPIAADIGETIGTEGLPEAAGKAAVYGLAPQATEAGLDAGLNAVGKLRAAARTNARSAARAFVGASPFKVTEKLAESKATQMEKVAGRNAAAEAAHIKAAQQAITDNRTSALATSRTETVAKSIEKGSRELGDRITDLDSKLRAEGNEKYSAVNEAVKSDPGEPIEDLLEAVDHAEKNIIKGSPESIKQFRDIARQGDIAADGSVSADLPFDKLQGYSSELGTKLAAGNLPGDVYQALKYVKSQIDSAKTRIADRNGAGALLRNADKFWNHYLDTFYDSDSAVAKIRSNVGVVDPQFYAEPFTKGKSAGVGLGKLGQMPTRYAAEIKGVQQLADNLRKAQSSESFKDYAGTDIVTTNAPKPIEIPKAPVPKTVKPLTPENLTASMQRAVKSKSAELVAFRRFDAMVMAGSTIGILLGADPVKAIVSGAGAIGLEKGMGAVLNRPGVINWISKPVPGDIAALSRLSEPARTTLATQLKTIIDQERQAGRPVPIDPAVSRFIGTASVVGTPRQTDPNKPIRTRQEALELLNR